MKNKNQDWLKKPDYIVTFNNLNLAFFVLNENRRNTSAIYCWIDELTPVNTK